MDARISGSSIVRSSTDPAYNFPPILVIPGEGGAALDEAAAGRATPLTAPVTPSIEPAGGNKRARTHADLETSPRSDSNRAHSASDNSTSRRFFRSLVAIPGY
jgi:hypothetical protein